ncbi:hypothetical protein MSP8886_04039 [Marinomonas spartinae]|uniref:Uncharacterized protein n=1 Tax=Marinomonas spartinae TaxID=1792290 RepID=A0A1A8TRR0_9GAMM|nr:hypothetical protein MSP8886_04039 [Marinomonas spartinae]
MDYRLRGNEVVNAGRRPHGPGPNFWRLTPPFYFLDFLETKKALTA